MELYNVPRRTWVRLLESSSVPVAAYDLKAGDELFFDHVDGMYSLCYKPGVSTPVHPVAWAEVEIIDDGRDPPNQERF